MKSNRNSRRRKENIRRIRLILLLALIVPTSGWTVTKVANHFNLPTIIAQEGEGAVKGEGEGAVKGEGESAVKGEGESAVKGEGEGADAVKGEGEGEGADAVKGEGEGAGAENLLSDQTHQLISLAALSLSIIALTIALLPYIIKKSKKSKKSKEPSSNHQNNFSAQPVFLEQQVEENDINNNEIIHQINSLNEQIPSIVNRQVDVNRQLDLDLKSIKGELQDIKNYLRVNNQMNQAYPDVQSPPVEEQLNYPNKQRDRDQDQPRDSYENIANSSYQAVSYQTPKLVETYNRDPRSSTRGAIEVSETQNSMSDRSIGKSKTVTLETKSRGYYAILKEGTIDYLVPSKYLRITDNNYQTVQALFECRNYKKGYSENFNLIKPAIVSTISANQQWQLQERGVLEFI